VNVIIHSGISLKVDTKEWRCSLCLENLPSKGEALSTSPSTPLPLYTKKERQKKIKEVNTIPDLNSELIAKGGVVGEIRYYGQECSVQNFMQQMKISYYYLIISERIILLHFTGNKYFFKKLLLDKNL
jgi:hypothetical protein